MRPLVSSSIVLAAAALVGVVAVAASNRLPGWSGTRPSAFDAAPAPTGSSFESPPPSATRPAHAGARVDLTGGASSARAVDLPEGLPAAHEFFFTRAAYNSSMRGWGRGSWSTDYPKADRQFLTILDRLVGIDAYGEENAILLTDPNVRRFPFLYALEVGRMNLRQEEVQGLRSYLEAGGFLVIDDFWGSSEWANFEFEMRRVLPGRPIVDLPLDHPLFHAFYDIEEVLQVPNVRNGTRGGPYWERDGIEPAVKGIFDEEGRLMVVINWNTDLGDAWEWAENPFYPLDRSTFAIQMGANMIVYAMSH